MRSKVIKKYSLHFSKSLKMVLLVSLTKSVSIFIKMLTNHKGESLPGKIALRLNPGTIRLFSEKKNIVLVAGTNGKTSTTQLLAQNFLNYGEVASNSDGANLLAGVAAALVNKANNAAIEVDELHLPIVIDETNPKVVLLLNLTRDQLHRMHEVKRVADRWCEACTKATNTTFVIDVDDPFLNYATQAAAHVIKVSFGGRRHPDGSVCPA